jgi:chaperone required for assembly of F1-ATPase
MNGRSRFYRDVTVAESHSPAPGYSILLDAKTAMTPSGKALILPTRALAEAVADEWRAQGEKILPATMLLTRLANTAIDRTAENRRETETQILALAKSDLVCYRAETPAELVARQHEVWDPLLEWLMRVYGARLVTSTGIAFVEQPHEALRALEDALARRGDFELTGLLSAATLCGSAVLALALADGLLAAEAAFATSQIDAIFQSERWGKDMEAEERFLSKQAELIGIARFMRLLQT